MPKATGVMNIIRESPMNTILANLEQKVCTQTLQRENLATKDHQKCGFKWQTDHIIISMEWTMANVQSQNNRYAETSANLTAMSSDSQILLIRVW